MSEVLWLLRFARPATVQLVISTLARILGQTLSVIMLAVPAWTVGALALDMHVLDAHVLGAQSLNTPSLGTHAAAAPTTTADSWTLIITVVLVFAVAALLRAGLRYVEQLSGHLAAFGLMGEMRVWIIDQLIPQAPAVTDGEGANRVNQVAVSDVDRVEVFFAHTIAPAITAILIPAGAITAAAFLAGPWPALVLAVVLGVGVIVPVAALRSGRRAATDTAEVRAAISTHVADTVILREEILASAAEANRLRTASHLDRRLGRVLTTVGIRSGLLNSVGALRLWLGTLAVLAAGSGELVAAPEKLPGVLAAAALVAGTATSVEIIERLAGSLPAGLESTARIRTLAQQPPVTVEPDQPVTLPGAKRSTTSPAVADPPAVAHQPAGDHQPTEVHPAPVAHPPAVAFHNLRFTYPGRSNATLTDVTLTCPPGHVTGIVGATGSGKSTVSRLIQRHFDPSAGQLTIHGIAATHLGSQQVQQLVAVCDQNPFLLNDTVEANLRLAHPQATPAQLQWALAHSDLPLDLNTPVGRRGNALSGGQSQRLALARTLLRASIAPGGLARAIIVLDEATSHQDALTQQRILNQLGELEATVVLIAHRLATVRQAHTIYVLEAGQVIEAGNFDQLASSGGAFAALLAATEDMRSSAAPTSGQN